MIGLYSLVGQRGFYFKNKNGYDGLGGATLQITKNFKTLRTDFHKKKLIFLPRFLENVESDMTGDEGAFEVNQEINPKGRIGPLRDTFFLVLSSYVISHDIMGDFINSCFNPGNLQERNSAE